MLFTLTQNEAQALEGMCPEGVINQIDKPLVFTLGYFDDEGFLEGVLQFTANDKTPEPTGLINYIFVPKTFRNNGAGSVLVMNALSIMSDSNINKCEIKLPSTDEYAYLRKFFESNYFSFDDNGYIMYSAPLKYYYGSNIIMTVETDSVRSISSLDNDEFASYVTELSQNREILLSVNPEDYQKQLSCYIDIPYHRGLFLVKELSGEVLEVAFLGTDDEASNASHKLIAFSLKKAREKYSSHTLINVPCQSERSITLAKELFPRIPSVTVTVGSKTMEP